MDQQQPQSHSQQQQQQQPLARQLARKQGMARISAITLGVGAASVLGAVGIALSLADPPEAPQTAVANTATTGAGSSGQRGTATEQGPSVERAFASTRGEEDDDGDDGGDSDGDDDRENQPQQQVSSARPPVTSARRSATPLPQSVSPQQQSVTPPSSTNNRPNATSGGS